MTKYCQNCNRPNANSAQYCIHCGELLYPEDDYPQPLKQDAGQAEIVCKPPKTGAPATVEFVLGLLGGVTGFILGSVLLLAGIFYASFLNYLVSSHVVSSAGSLSSLGTIVLLLGIGEIIFSVLGIWGAVVSARKSRKGGQMMVASSIGVFLCFPLVSILAFILLLSAGILSLRNRQRSLHREASHPEEQETQRRRKKVKRKSKAGMYAGILILIILGVIGIALIVVS